MEQTETDKAAKKLGMKGKIMEGIRKRQDKYADRIIEATTVIKTI